MALDSDVEITEIAVAAGGVITPEFSTLKPCSTGAIPFVVPANDYCDFTMGSDVVNEFHGGRIESSGAKFMVGHYMQGASATDSGDASMQFLVPAERFRCAHRFFSFAGFDFDPLDLLKVNGTYVAIVARTPVIDSVLLDGVALAVSCNGPAAEAIPGSGYSWRKCRLPNPCGGVAVPVTCPYGEEHTVSAAEGVGVYVYGHRAMGSARGAYAYPAGFGVQQ